MYIFFRQKMTDRRVVQSSTFSKAISTFWCDACGVSFSQREQMSRHRRDMHGPKVYCQYCGTDYAQSRKRDLKAHETRCSKDTYRTKGRHRVIRQNRSRSPKTERDWRAPRSYSPRTERESRSAYTDNTRRHTSDISYQHKPAYNPKTSNRSRMTATSTYTFKKKKSTYPTSSRTPSTTTKTTTYQASR